MNIFILDENPTIAAKYHSDVHLNKMLLESAQMLCNVHHYVGTENVPYKATHMNHPCSVWARTSLSNYNWLLLLAFEIENERIFRGFKRSKCLDTLMWCRTHTPSIPELGRTDFAIVTTGQDSTGMTAVEAYRKYYIDKKQGVYVKQHKLSGDNYKISKFRRHTWKRRGMPEWFANDISKPRYRCQYKKKVLYADSERQAISLIREMSNGEMVMNDYF
jgi:hypothetical protein